MRSTLRTFQAKGACHLLPAVVPEIGKKCGTIPKPKQTHDLQRRRFRLCRRQTAWVKHTGDAATRWATTAYRRLGRPMGRTPDRLGAWNNCRWTDMTAWRFPCKLLLGKALAQTNQARKRLNCPVRTKNLKNNRGGAVTRGYLGKTARQIGLSRCSSDTHPRNPHDDPGNRLPILRRIATMKL